MHIPKRNLRQEYRQKQREQVDASALIADKYPELKSLKVLLECFDSLGVTRSSEMKCNVNVKHARSALLFGCPGRECFGGDFDLTEALAEAVSAGHRVVTGELRCKGTRKRGDNRQVPCGTLLRYKVSLAYAPTPKRRPTVRKAARPASAVPA